MTPYVLALAAWAFAAVKLHLWWWTIAAPLLAGYLWSCARFPMTGCPRKCGGKVRDDSGSNWRNCWWCGGRGSRVRWGRRWFENVTGKKKYT